MKSSLLVLSLAALGAAGLAAQQRPKLVVVITVDQLRPDYFQRWKGQLTGGLGRLANEGAFFTEAYQDHGVTETAPGHSTVLSGRWPAHTGILRNDAGVQDSTTPLLESRGGGASPQRFQGTAFFDWLKAAQPTALALSVSRKDRGAILPIGRAKEQVYWYSNGLFTTSTYYRDALPIWVQRFNALRVPFRSIAAVWKPLLPDSAYKEPDDQPWENPRGTRTFPHVEPSDSVRAAAAYVDYPWMDSLTLAFALAGAQEMKLGKHGATDLLAVSLSTTDAIGHAYGPDSREIHDQVLRLDRYLGAFLDQLGKMVGKNDLLIVLTADHGVTSYPGYSRANGRPDVHAIVIDSLIGSFNRDISARMGDTSKTRWFLFDTGMLIQQDNGRLAAAHLAVDSIVGAIAARLKLVPGIARADRPGDLAQADTLQDPTARRWRHHIPTDAPIPLVVTLREPFVWETEQLAEHGQPSDNDAHVPLILVGRAFKPGRYTYRAATVDIAPTLASVLRLQPFSLLDGRVLREALSGN